LFQIWSLPPPHSKFVQSEEGGELVCLW
jgi:hypothetical protein